MGTDHSEEFAQEWVHAYGVVRRALAHVSA
jgi:hypothetical protein